jgi:hypothetical protein
MDISSRKSKKDRQYNGQKKKNSKEKTSLIIPKEIMRSNK